MKKNILDELTELDDEIMAEIAGKAPEPDEKQIKRIAGMCAEKAEKGYSEAGDSVSGTEVIRHRRFSGFFAAAAAVVMLTVSGAGVYALSRSMTPDAPSLNDQSQFTQESERLAGAENGLQIENTSGYDDATSSDVITTVSAQENIDVTTVTATSVIFLPHYTTTQPEGIVEVPGILKPQDTLVIPVDNGEDIPESTEAAANIHYPNQPEEVPVNTEPTEPAIICEPPVTTTVPKVYEPTEPPVTTTTKPAETHLGWNGGIVGYWFSDWGGQSQYYFGENGIGNFYNSNTCWGYTFSYNYYPTHGQIEIMALGADGRADEEHYATGTLNFTSGNTFTITWKVDSPLHPDGESEHFTPNTSEAMNE